MENFDIEKLERKNIYAVPENFFETVQQNVFQKIDEETKTEAPVVPLNQPSKKNWWYAAAAALAMIFGLTMFFNNSKNQKETAQPMEIAKAEPVQPVEVKETPIETAQPLAVAEILPKEDLTKPEIVHQTKEFHPEVVKKAPQAQFVAAKSVRNTAERQTEKILAALPKEDVMALAVETEPDVYLELYN